MLRCVIVDDSPVFLEAAASVLERHGVRVVGVAGTAQEAVERVQELRPDVTLLDVNLGAESGFEVARRLSQEAGVEPEQMILISTEDADEYADLLVDSPVAGFLSKAALSGAGIRELLGLA